MEEAQGSQPDKRKRVGTACDVCRKSKIKCNGELPQCSRCARIKLKCVYTPVARKNVPVKRTKLIEGLEDRLNRIESFVMSDLVSENLDLKASDRRRKSDSTYELNGGSDPSDPSYPSRPAATRVSAKKNSLHLARETATLRSESMVVSTGSVEAESMDFVTTDMKGQSHYIGSASGFSIFSPKGIAWVNDKVGDAQFISIISSAKCDHSSWGRSDMITDITLKRLHRRLPPKEEARALLREFFDDFNSVMPLFHEAMFMSLFESHFTREYDPVHGAGWWASLNMVLATTHRLRVLNNLTLQDEDEIASLYFKNAMASLTELILRVPNILNLQALLAMAIYSQGASNIELSCFLVAAAVRLSQDMGMHRESSGAKLSLHETQERRRLFWIGYILDKNTSLRFGRPPNQDDDDMDVQLPGGKFSNGTSAMTTVNGRFADTFRAMCELAVIEGKVYKRLYSVQASNQSTEEVVKTVDQLDKELEGWRQTVPEQFRPQSDIKVSDDALRLHIINFHMAYYQCLATIHRKLVQHGHWINRPESLMEDGAEEEIRKHVFSSAVLCVSAARASINLIRFIPQGNLACIWIMLCYVVMSYLALCVNIYQNPKDSKAPLDLKLMKIVTNFLSVLKSDESDPAAHHLIEICGEFERLARRAVKNAQEKRASDLVHSKSAPSPPTSNDPITPTSTINTTQTNSLSPELEISISSGVLEGNSTRLQSVNSSCVGAPDSTMYSQGMFLSSSGTVEASQTIGMGGEEMDFTDSVLLPEHPGTSGASDFWQLPMPLEWNWTDMNANYFLPME